MTVFLSTDISSGFLMSPYKRGSEHNFRQSKGSSASMVQASSLGRLKRRFKSGRPHLPLTPLNRQPKPSLNYLNRVIGHLDLDYFYAQVEEVQNPSLRGRPIVCGFSCRSEESGVVSTANNVARRLGSK